MPSGVRPATAWKPTSSSKMLGIATVRPIATTSLASDELVWRCRKIRRSSSRPIAGASTRTDTTKAGMVPQPHTSRAWKYMAAET